MDEVMRLLNDYWRVVLFLDGLDQYSALAVPPGGRADRALKEWFNYEVETDDLEGLPEREAIKELFKRVAEKVLFGHLPVRDQAEGEGDGPEGP
jgi:hypothetical protein